MGTVSSTSSASISADYMNLLVVQLQNQNPLEPMDNNQMASQLAQLSQLEQLEKMNSSFQDVLASQLETQAISLIGKNVAYVPSGGTAATVGTVDGVDNTYSDPRLIIGNQRLQLSDILAIG